MPSQKGKSGFLAKYGDKLRKAHEEHRGKETDYGAFSDLPDGIEGGIAQLIDVKIEEIKPGKENAGEYQFRAVGIAKHPEALPDGRRVAGGRTTIIEPIYDTPNRTRKTVSAHWDWVLNQLRMLGLETADMDAEEVESNLVALKEAGPHFKFRTWKGAKQTEGQYKDREPRVQHTWQGLVDFDEATGEVGAGLDDQTGASRNGEPVNEFNDAQAAVEEPVVETAEAVEDSQPEQEDLDALAEAASSDDTAAVDRLTELAKAAGMKQREIDNADSWQAVADRIHGLTSAAPEEGTDEEGEGEEGGEEDGEAEETEEAVAGPKLRDPVRYRPPDPKTKKPQKKAVECQVTAVYANTRTADLKSLDNPKNLYKAVPWAELEY